MTPAQLPAQKPLISALQHVGWHSLFVEGSEMHDDHTNRTLEDVADIALVAFLGGLAIGFLIGWLA